MKRPRRSNSSNIHYNLDSGDSDFEARINVGADQPVSPRAIDHQNPKRKRESYSPEQHDVRRTLRRGRQAPNHIIHDHDTSHDEEDRVEASHHRHSSGQRQSRIVRINVRAPVAPSMSDETNDDPISANRSSGSKRETGLSPPRQRSPERDVSSPELQPTHRARKLRQSRNVLHESDSDERQGDLRPANGSKNIPPKKNAEQRHRSDEDDYIEDSDDLDDAEITTDDSLISADDVKEFIVSDDDDIRNRRRRLRRRPPRRPNGRTTRRSTRRKHANEDGNSDFASEEDLQAELDEIRSPIREVRQRNLRDRTNRPDYAIPPPLTEQMIPASHETKSRPTTTLRNLYPMYASLGLGLTDVGQKTFGNFGPPTGLVSDSDSSDEEGQTNRVKNPTTGANLTTSLKGPDVTATGSANVTIKAKSSKLADADPLGVDMSVDFDSVGGLSEHVNQLKEMVSLPLLYPEIFERFHITPPRGVLFHGPPGTGKTLMARALAASCSSESRKISFYMRKGADCLSKWVGEAERQLRLLFDEARNNQPSIIFFDEIDGLAPVRSAKQDQIHASIVSTLLALMDGMDSRGQVVVIGATNRPDSVDPALRRPGRFDREFYFPLPALEARRQILDIHTSKWSPKLDPGFKQQLALQTKGYGGADIRALCTEAALNAVQRKYPQIYVSKDKLVINPAAITVSAKDFMLAIKKIIPSSARTTSSGAAILPDHLRALLAKSASVIFNTIDSLVAKPRSQNTLEHNLKYIEKETTFQEEEIQQVLQEMKIYRPTILISGPNGCGQQHIGRAILHYLEGYHVQILDLAMLFGNPTNSPEVSIVQAFVEAKRHKPSVICLMQLEIWSFSASDNMITTLKSLLSSINPHEPILLLGIASVLERDLSPAIGELFDHSAQNIELGKPTEAERKDFLQFLKSFIARQPSEMSGIDGQAPRILEDLPLAPPPLPRQISKDERKAIENKDRKLKLILKAKLSPLLELLKTRFKRFKKAMIEEKDISPNPSSISLPVAENAEILDYERTSDEMILQKATGKKFYNTDINLIEERLWSNLYLTPKQFQLDIERILHDVLQDDSDRERVLRAKEMHTTVLLHLEELFDSAFLDECKEMALREIERHRKYSEKQEKLLKAHPTDTNRIEDESHRNQSVCDLLPGTVVRHIDQASLTNLHEDASMVDVSPLPGESDDVRMLSDIGPSAVIMAHDQPKDTGPAIIDNSVYNNSIQSSVMSKGWQEHNKNMNPVESVTQDVHTASSHIVDLQRAIEPREGLAKTYVSSEDSNKNPYLLDGPMLDTFIQNWAKATAGFSVDQMEHLNSLAIDRLWSMRGTGDRNELARATNEVVSQTCDRFNQDK